MSILLEELGADYRLKLVDIGRGEQFAPEFLAISPNNRMPAIVDHAPAPAHGDGPVSVFESGAIMLYLAERFGRFMPGDPRGRKDCLEWLFWQVGNQGPMGGQLSHFINYAEGEHPYARERYGNEYDRCLGVLERRLDGRRYLLGDEYSIADMINWPWVLIAGPLHTDLAPYPNVRRWRAELKTRPAVQRGVDLGKAQRRRAPPTAAERDILFRQRGHN